MTSSWPLFIQLTHIPLQSVSGDDSQHISHHYFNLLWVMVRLFYPNVLQVILEFYPNVLQVTLEFYSSVLQVILGFYPNVLQVILEFYSKHFCEGDR